MKLIRKLFHRHKWVMCEYRYVQGNYLWDSYTLRVRVVCACDKRKVVTFSTPEKAWVAGFTVDAPEHRSPYNCLYKTDYVQRVRVVTPKEW